MVTPFAARDAIVSGAVDRAFGEQFTFVAMRVAASGDVNLPKEADPAKPTFTCAGVWEAPAQAEYPKGRGSNPDDEALRRAMSYPAVSVDDTLLQWMPTEGAMVTRVFDGSVYKVMNSLPDGFGRTVFTLTSGKR